MTRTLKLKGRTGLFDVPSFIVTENEVLKIRIQSDEPRKGRFRLTIRHGNLKRTYTLSKGETIELSPEWLKENAENLDFSLAFLDPAETYVVKDDYQIEPLKMETLDGNFTFTAQVQEILRRQDEQEEMIHIIKEKLEDYEENGVPLILEKNE